MATSITLLNCDYKTVAKTIAYRIKKLLPRIINSDQRGVLKGRIIGENIRLINEIIDYTKSENINGLLLFLYFEKLLIQQMEYVYKTFKPSNFGEKCIAWVKLLQIMNGPVCFWVRQRFKRRLFSFSLSLYILRVEVLVIAIKSNKNIKDITVKSKNTKTANAQLAQR